MKKLACKAFVLAAGALIVPCAMAASPGSKPEDRDTAALRTP